MPRNHLSNVGEVKKHFESKTGIHTSTFFRQSLHGHNAPFVHGVYSIDSCGVLILCSEAKLMVSKWPFQLYCFLWVSKEPYMVHTAFGGLTALVTSDSDFFINHDTPMATCFPL